MIPAGPFILEEDAFGGKVAATDGTGLSAVVDSSIKIISLNVMVTYTFLIILSIILCIVNLVGGRVQLNTANRTIFNTGL